MGGDTLQVQLGMKIRDIKKRIEQLPAPIEPPSEQEIEDEYVLDAFKKGTEQYNAFVQQAKNTQQKIQQIEQDIAQIQSELKSSGYFADWAHGSELDAFKQYLDKIAPLLVAKKVQYEEAKKNWSDLMQTLGKHIASPIIDLAQKANLYALKTSAETIEGDLDSAIDSPPKGLVSLTQTKIRLRDIKDRLSEHMRKYEPIHQLIIEAWDKLPFKNPGYKKVIDEYNKYLVETKEIVERTIEKFEKYVKTLSELQLKLEKETEEAKWVRNYPDLYFLHGVEIKGGEFWEHNLATKFPNSLEAIEYNIKNRPQLAYTKSDKPQDHLFVVGLRAIDGEITVVDAVTQALASGERIARGERETCVTDPITKKQVWVKYDIGRDITKENIRDHGGLRAAGMGGNELVIKNPVFDGIWIDARIFNEDMIYYGVKNVNQMIESCKALAKKYNLKLYIIHQAGIEEVDPDDDARLQQIIALENTLQ